VLYLTDIYEMYLFLVFFISRSACQRSVTMMTDFVERAMQQYDQQGCLHEQFVKQAKATPDTIAVVTHNGHKVTKNWRHLLLGFKTQGLGTTSPLWSSSVTKLIVSFTSGFCHVFILWDTSRGTQRCPGWPMAKPDSNFVYYVTKKKGDGINCGNVSEWNMRHVMYGRVQYLRKSTRKKKKAALWMNAVSCSTVNRKAKACNETGMLPSVWIVTEVLCFPSGAGM